MALNKRTFDIFFVRFMRAPSTRVGTETSQPEKRQRQKMSWWQASLKGTLLASERMVGGWSVVVPIVFEVEKSRFYTEERRVKEATSKKFSVRLDYILLCD